MSQQNHISLKTKIIINALILVLFAVLIVFVYFVYSAQINKINNKTAYIDEIRESVNALDYLNNTILSSSVNNTGISSEQSDQFTKSLNNIQTKFYGTLNEFMGTRLTRHNSQILTLTDTIKNNFNLQSGNTSLLISSLFRRGTANSGLAADFLKSGNVLISPAETNSQIFVSLQELRLLAYKMIYTKEPGINDEINRKITEAETFIQEITEPETIDKIQNDLNTFRSLSLSVSNLDKTLGNSNAGSGLIAEIKTGNNLLSLQVDHLDMLIRNNIAKTKIYSFFVFLFLFIILTGLTVYSYLHNSFRFLINPVKRILAFTGKLKTGFLPDEELKTGTTGSFHMMAENIDGMIKGLKEKYKFTRALNDRDLKIDFKPSGDDDLLGNELIKLQKYIQQSAEEHRLHDEENFKRRYINEGLAKFSELTHAGYDSIEKLTDNFIRELVKYLNSIQGGVFLVDDQADTSELFLSSAFAYNRKKYLSKKIAFGEGLVGTCAVEKKTIHLSQMPDDYMKITSGLGDAPPKYLLLIPVKLEETLLGVVELASLNKYKDFEIEFLEQVAGNLASTLNAARDNEKTTKLLLQSQQQALEMAEQEEEMRQNMEELKATQEESARREEEFRGIVDALGNSLFMAELTLNGEFKTINDNFLLFLGKKSEETVGKGFHQIVNSKNPEIVNQKLLENMKKGKVEVTADLVRIGKKEHNIQFYFSPVLNRESTPVKILCLGVEIKK